MEIFQLVTFSYPYFRLSKLRVIHMTSYREIFFFYEDFYHLTITLSRVQFFINRCWTSPSSNRPPFLPSPPFSNPSNPLEINHSPSFPSQISLDSSSIFFVDFLSKEKKKGNSLSRIEEASKWIVRYEIYQVCDRSTQGGGRRNKKMLTERSEKDERSSFSVASKETERRIDGNGGNRSQLSPSFRSSLSINR